MKPLITLGLCSALALCVGLTGCKQESKLVPVDTTSPPKAAAHDHSDVAQHGGAIVEVGGHVALLEIVHDGVAGVVRMWVYAMNGSAMPLDEPPVLNVPGDEPKQLTGGDEDGAWTFRDEALAGHVHGGRLRVSIGGVPYSPALPDVH